MIHRKGKGILNANAGFQIKTTSQDRGLPGTSIQPGKEQDATRKILYVESLLHTANKIPQTGQVTENKMFILAYWCDPSGFDDGIAGRVLRW